jgi:hypothetical protein
VLWRPLRIPLRKVAPLVSSMMLLHNLCINRRIASDNVAARDTAALFTDGWSQNGGPTTAPDGCVAYLSSGNPRSSCKQAHLPCTVTPDHWAQQEVRARGNAKGSRREELKAVLKANGLVRPDRSTYSSMAPRGGADAPTTFL